MQYETRAEYFLEKLKAHNFAKSDLFFGLYPKEANRFARQQNLSIKKLYPTQQDPNDRRYLFRISRKKAA
jgi:hypothetical protein